MKQFAIIGSTASGKSDLALSMALRHNAIILSIDSLSVYKKIDIASAKPSADELSLVHHFGIDCLMPDENGSVFTFIDEYHRAIDFANKHTKNLIIVGGSSFYLKSMLDGLSPIPAISESTQRQAAEILTSLEEAHSLLARVDPKTMSAIHSSDRYRIEKMLLLYLETSMAPSRWFETHPPVPVIPSCPVYDLKIERPVLRERISLRTRNMIANHLIDEVAELERLYGRHPNSMKAIGIIETLEYLDGKCSKEELFENISTHTAQLAKRQQTFNAHQFSVTSTGNSAELSRQIDFFLQQP